MKHNREFEIAFVGLKPGEHTYDYTIADSFFAFLLIYFALTPGSRELEVRDDRRSKAPNATVVWRDCV